MPPSTTQPCPVPVADLLAFISAHWDDTVRHVTEDSGQIIGLPHPYTVPCRKDTFQELYYWDTFYTNEGLLAQGRVELARQNVDNILHLVGRFGYMPNGNRTYYLTRSQPPHLALMVERVFAHTADRAWLAAALPRLEDELTFWSTQRRASCGLNHYGHHADNAELIQSAQGPDNRGNRAGKPPAVTAADRVLQSGHSNAECESGWDFCPRFDGRCMDFCPVDLNALLYASEYVLSRSHRLLGDPAKADAWETRAALRATLMRDLLWSPELGAFNDYDHVAGLRSTIVSPASFYLIWLGLTTPAESASTLALLPQVERPHGILTCVPGPRVRICQWDAPNAWPPLQYATVQALLAAGRPADARRVAAVFFGTVARSFAATGDLWEKYNAETGDLHVQNEYGLPAMMGWTAGVSVVLGQLLSPDSSPLN